MTAPANREFYYPLEEEQGHSRFRGWTPSEVDWALDSHAEGDFSQSALLAADFSRDKRIPGIRRSIVNGFVGRQGLPFSMLPSERGDQRRATSIASMVAERWWDWFPDDVMRRLVTDFVDLGVAVARVLKVATTSEWIPVLDPWPMERVRWDKQAKQWRTTDPQGNPLVITPGRGWLMFGSARARSWLEGAVSPVGSALVERAYVTRAWLRWCERHGNPILGIKEPDVGGDAKKKAEVEAFFRKMGQNLGSRGIVRLPQGNDAKTSWALEMIEASGNGWQGCKALIDKTDTDIAIAYTGQNMSNEVTGGSFAAATALLTVRGDELASVAAQVATSGREQLIPEWGRDNIEGWTDSLSPWPTYQTTPPESPEARAKRQEQAAKAYKAWWDLRLQVDLVQAAKDEGVPLTSDELREPDPVAPAVPPIDPTANPTQQDPNA